ncbi:hypothetical protein EV175_002146 [Coemansia sp. RSA 1933]|nr:hypothetical protein EV175_002146 [Coemansia sp. RSA 1933]
MSSLALIDDELDSADETVTEDTTPTTKPTPVERVLPVADTQNVSVEVYESENLSRLDEQPYWRQFVCGKQHKSKTKSDDPSRAYILFAETEEAAHFYRHFHGHAFGKNGSVHRAIVELAPFQHVAWSLTSTTTTDQCSLEGTIEKDAHFVAFLKTLGNGGGSSQSSEESAVVNPSSAGTTGIQQKPRVSYAAATAASGKGHGEPDKVGNKVTPLIEHLRKIKTGATKPPSTVSRKVEASGGSLAKPTSSKQQGRKKAAVKEPPSSSSVPATAKRSRRRKRE